MAFTNNNTRGNTQWKEKNINTSSKQFRNSKVGTMIVGFWNGCLTIKIHPLLPSEKRSEASVYDYDSMVNVALTQDKVQDICIQIKRLIQSIEDGDCDYNFGNVGVAAGNGYIEIKAEENETISVTIYSDIDENGMTDKYLTYTFNKRHAFKNYDSKGGSFDSTDDYEGEFLSFARILTEFLKASTNAYAHAERNANKYTVGKMYEGIEELKKSAGITSGNNTASGQSSANSYFMGIGGKNKNSQANDDTIEYHSDDRLSL